MNDKINLSASYLSKAQADKKYIKRLSNAFTVPLIGMQFIGAAVMILAAVIEMLIHVSVMHDTGSFSLSSFMSFLTSLDNSDWLAVTFSTLSYFAYMFIPFVIIAAVLRQNP